MAICKKGYSMETKTCGIVCAECEFYDRRTKMERLKAKAGEWSAQLKTDMAEYAPEDCDHCKYCDGGTGGFMSYCEAAGRSFKPFEKRKTICPLEKYKKGKR